MADPVAGLREMARVTRPGGVVVACVWDYTGERSPLSTFWRAVVELDADRCRRGGPRRCRGEGHLVELAESAGLATSPGRS